MKTMAGIADFIIFDTKKKTTMITVVKSPLNIRSRESPSTVCNLFLVALVQVLHLGKKAIVRQVVGSTFTP